MVRTYDESAIPTVYNFAEVPVAREKKGSKQRLFRGLDLMIGFNEVDPEKEPAHPHSHPWEQINIVIEGSLKFIVGDEEVELEKYDILEIPPGVEHTSRVVPGESAKHLAFWPLRDDKLDACSYQKEFNFD